MKKQNNNAFARKRRQLHFAVRVMEKHAKGILQLSISEFRKLQRRILTLLDDLRVGNCGSLIQRGTALLVLLTGGQTAEVHAQSFGAPVTNPFEVDLVLGNALFPALVDIDDDGDLDLFISGYSVNNSEYEWAIQYQENIGTQNSPEFGAVIVNPFGIKIDNYESLFTTFGDIDQDGDVDILAYKNSPSSGVFEFALFTNAGTASNPIFANPSLFELEQTGGISHNMIPTLVDLDDDGDLDLMGATRYYDFFTGYYFNDFLYYENVTENQGLKFAESELAPFGLPSIENGLLTNLAPGDLDNDGDTDLLSVTLKSIPGGTIPGYFYYENTGSASAPQFSGPVSSPFGLDTDSVVDFPTLADLDDDGDLDVFAATYDLYLGFNFTSYYENEQATGFEYLDGQVIEMKLFPNPVSDILTLSANIQLDHDLQVEIFDMLGQRILGSVWNEGMNLKQIDVRNLTAGTYLVRLFNEKGYVTQKFSKSE